MDVSERVKTKKAIFRKIDFIRNRRAGLEMARGKWYHRQSSFHALHPLSLKYSFPAFSPVPGEKEETVVFRKRKGSYNDWMVPRVDNLRKGY